MSAANSALELLINLFPKQIRTPARFYSYKFRGKLEYEIFYLSKLIKRRGCAIDIGANQGMYAYALSKFCDSIEVFEPQAWCTEEIKSYSQSFGKRINVYNCALSSSNSTLDLNIPILRGRLRTSLSTGLASFGKCDGEFESINVSTSKLDDYDFRNVVFIKIDVEGHESKVIQGARETILREKPVILIEIEQRHLGETSLEMVFNEIKGLGYQGTFLHRQQILPLECFSYEKHQKLFLIDLNKADYINNFIFMPCQD